MSVLCFRENFNRVFSLVTFAKKDFAEYIANENFKNVKFILLFSCVSSLVNFIGSFFTPFKRTYFLAMPVCIFFVSFIFVIIHRILKKLNVGCFAKQVYSYLVFLISVLATIIPLFFAPTFITCFLVLSSLFVISCVSMHLNPLFFTAIVISEFIVISFKQFGRLEFRSYSSYSVLLSFFFLMIIILSFYKRSISLSNFNVRRHLQHRNDALEKELLKKTIALLNQSKYSLELQHETIIGLANLVECRDNETGNHVKRTSEYVALLATAAAKKDIYADVLTADYIELLRRAAPLHDVGKIVVSDTILKKRGKLTPEEFYIMKTHASEGGRIVNTVLGNLQDKDYIRVATEVAEFHHEKWNGKGYPNGLSGQNIPLSARIMAVADVFDALSAARCYKEPFTVEKSLEIIKEGAGEHFDPSLAMLFISLKQEVSEILSKYNN